MGSAGQVRDWLSWLVKVRILVILFLLGIELVVRQFAPSPVPIKYFLTLVLLWIALALFYAILRVVERDPYLEGHLQLAVDLLVVTGLVYVTGSLESYFVFLYLLVIIVASILLSRVGAFLLAALAFLLFAGLVEAAYLLKAIPPLYPQVGGPWPGAPGAPGCAGPPGRGAGPARRPPGGSARRDRRSGCRARKGRKRF